MNYKNHSHFYLIIIALFSITVVRFLFTQGMFVDGTIYAAISNNLSYDIGTFWAPHLSKGLFNQFYEHPPLALGLQSILFHLTNHATYTERLYSIITALITAFIIIQIWKHLTHSTKTAWLPLLLWLTVDTVTWGYTNNMLENTMTIFVCLSALLFFKNNNKNNIALILSGISLSLALLSKGFVCLYIWTLPFFAWMYLRQIKLQQAIYQTLILLASTLVPIALLYFFNDAAANNFTSYLNQQVIRSVEHIHTVSNRWVILYMFVEHALAPLLITAIIISFGIKKNTAEIKNHLKTNKPYLLLFSSIVICGIVPITISLKQSNFYILSVYPFFAIAAALSIKPLVEHQVNRLKTCQIKIIKGLSITLIVVSLLLTYNNKGKIIRHKQMIVDCHNIINTTGKNSTLIIPDYLYTNWGLHSYFARYGNISLSKENTPNKNVYYLCSKNDSTPPNHVKINIRLHHYSLFQRK